MPSLSNKDKKYITDTVEKAVLDAGYKMKVRAGLGDTLEFSDFSKEVGSNLALSFAMDMAMAALKKQGINLSLGGGGGFDSDYMPDRYTLIIDGKRVYGAVSWDF